MGILPDRFPQRVSTTLLTTIDAARLLQVTPRGVRKLARGGAIPYEETLSGQLLFRYGLVMKVVEQRAAARLHHRAQRLAAVHLRMIKAGAAGEARQLTLDFSRRLVLVGARGKGRKVA